MSTFQFYFGIPDGAVYGNLVADLIGLVFAFIFRHRLMRLFVEFHHKHKIAHLARLEKEKNG
jgi:hypothetical protein